MTKQLVVNGPGEAWASAVDGHLRWIHNAALDALAAERGRHAFRVALVGEFNRGKSTLVNRLIRRDLLPTGPCPVTRAPVTVRAAPEESVRLTWPDGHREVRSLADGGPWAGLTGPSPSPMPQEGTYDAPAPTEPAVVAAVADAWLTELGIELVDLPGVNSGSEEQLEQVRRTAVASDAVLFVVSALSPMSSTEHRLLQEEVLCRHVPFVAVVVTLSPYYPPRCHVPVGCPGPRSRSGPSRHRYCWTRSHSTGSNSTST
ncbi:dynamin family protein [Streptomyces maoxianensis]|uniref:Dynamin family protein n=1 Tax=Streptomyces maoxianensis TaxID=1459942 RepID=A0ABV9G5X9_9ACTN